MLSELTIERLRMVKDAILREPKAYDQTGWGCGELPSCGSPCCIAGWAAALSGELPNYIKSPGAGGRWLGLTHEQQDALFEDWPDMYDGQGSPMTPASLNLGSVESANDGAAHIELFIAGGGEWPKGKNDD